jgi:hypothetical protein
MLRSNTLIATRTRRLIARTWLIINHTRRTLPSNRRNHERNAHKQAKTKDKQQKQRCVHGTKQQEEVNKHSGG